MTPREQIQEHARVAAKKVKEAMTEFAAATGMTASAYIDWQSIVQVDKDHPQYIVTGVTIAYNDEVQS